MRQTENNLLMKWFEDDISVKWVANDDFLSFGLSPHMEYQLLVAFIYLFSWVLFSNKFNDVIKKTNHHKKLRYKRQKLTD